MRFKLSSSLSGLLREQARWRQRMAKAVTSPAEPTVARSPKQRVGRTNLVEVNGFGANPGRLRMLEYVPPSAGNNSALVVVIHGCLQTVEDYDKGSGWTKLARDHGFILLFPEQRRENNNNLCFNWFRPSAVARDRGELMSIRQMIDSASDRHRIDQSRIYVHGLSAGAAMASALLVTYPNLFAAGQLVAGLPYGVARDAVTAMSVMKSGPRQTSEELAELARRVSPETTSWPTVSIWHGAADRIVAPHNAKASLQQWLHLHGLQDMEPRSVRERGGFVQRWEGAGSMPQVEFRLLDGLDHGLPIRPPRRKTNHKQPYMLESALDAPDEFVRSFIR